MDFVEAVYKVSNSFPREETFGLKGQLRRAAVSVPSNVAEGQSRRGSREFLQHIAIALGSLNEAETQILIAGRLEYITQEEAATLLASADEVGRLLNGLSNAIEKKL
jgi:four helix bundle protein